MDRYTIKIDLIEGAMRRCIDMAVHDAVSRHEDRLGDNVGLTSRIAQAAAANAVEQFRAWANSQLRLLEIEHERRASEASLHLAPLLYEGPPVSSEAVRETSKP